MKKMITHKLFLPVAIIVALIAGAFASTASILIFYQPKAPKCLHK